MNQVLLVNHELGMHSDLSMLLQESHFKNVVLDEVESGSEALRKVVSDAYDLLILNLDLPETNILGLLNNIKLLNPALPVLIFSSEIEYIIIKRYLTSGLNGYVYLKKNDLNEIIKAVVDISTGKWYISREMSELMVEQVLYNRKAERIDSLDEQEFEIFTHLIKEKTPATIAEIMALNVPTISIYKTRILDKLRIRNLKDLKNVIRLPLEN